MDRQTSLSKALSHALRHAPWEYELELDEEGWTSLDQVLDALRSLSEWKDITRHDIETVVSHSDKKRHEISNNRIRALYGHSIVGKLERQPKKPPAVLYHGTSQQTAKAILKDGLRPMGRQYIHLSIDVETAQRVGARKDRRPAILRVDAATATQEGVCFYEGNVQVWLADYIAPQYLSPLP